jgi:hypothetical protein
MKTTPSIEHFDNLIGLIKQDEFYVPREYQTIGGMWTIDTWERDGVRYQLMDEGYTQVITADNLKVVEGYIDGEIHIKYEKGNEQMIKELIIKFNPI